MYILWLTGWFPNKTSPLNGDFIARHALAASAEQDIVVLHAVKDLNLKQAYYESNHPGPRCSTITIYYPKTSNIPFLEKIYSTWKYFYLQWRFTRRYFRDAGKPALVHVHILHKAGYFALLLRIFYGLPFIVSEQDTRFLDADPASYKRSGSFTRFMIRNVLKRAGGLSAVSRVLANEIVRMAPGIRARVIPNVVDRRIFHPGDTSPARDVFRMIHISNFLPQKNIGKILEAMKILSDKAPGEFHLLVVGPHVERSFRDGWLEKSVGFLDEMDQVSLAGHMRTCHALVLYSRYETFGCVIIEALACGLPVILADIPVSHELVKENENGVLARPDDAADLADKMIGLRDGYSDFDTEKISRETIRTYSYETVGPQFSAWYAELGAKLSP